MSDFVKNALDIGQNPPGSPRQETCYGQRSMGSLIWRKESGLGFLSTNVRLGGVGLAQFSVPPTQIRCDQVRRYILPAAMAGVAWLFSPKGLIAISS
jgi:hypothetical protein